MMLKFRKIPSIKKLSDIVQGAKGNVYLQLSEDKFWDLKEGANITMNLENVLQQSKDIVIHIFDSKDYLDFLNFMAGTTYDESACI